MPDEDLTDVAADGEEQRLQILELVVLAQVVDQAVDLAQALDRVVQGDAVVLLHKRNDHAGDLGGVVRAGRESHPGPFSPYAGERRCSPAGAAQHRVSAAPTVRRTR